MTTWAIPPHVDILLIDASAPARYALRLELKALGADVRQAASAEQALPALRARRPDLVVAAPVLPGMNALELLELLQPVAGADAPPLVIHGVDAGWPLARAAAARGVLAVGTDAELLQRLPDLLRHGTRIGMSRAEALAAGTTPAQSPQDHLALPRADTASPVRPSAQRRQAACWRLMLAAALAGVLLGGWIAWLSGL